MNIMVAISILIFLNCFICDSLACIVSTIFMSYIYNKYRIKKLELSLKTLELNRIEQYSNRIEQLYESTMKFKHDYKNILLALHYYIEQKQYDELENYYKTHILQTASFIDNNDYIYRLKNLKISPLKALIASKLIRYY